MSKISLMEPSLDSTSLLSKTPHNIRTGRGSISQRPGLTKRFRKIKLQSLIKNDLTPQRVSTNNSNFMSQEKLKLEIDE